MDTAEFRKQLLDIRKILESFLDDYSKTQPNDFQNNLNMLNKEYELIHDSLLTVINYFSLQQNAIRSLLLIENVTREKNIKLQDADHLLNAIRVLILPQVETFLYNLKSAVKSKERVLTYLENNPIYKLPELVQDMVSMDKRFLSVVEQSNQSMTSNLLEQSLQSLLMLHLDNSSQYLEKIAENLQKPVDSNNNDNDNNNYDNDENSDY